MSGKSSRDQWVGDTQLQASFPAGIRLTGRMWNLISLINSPEGIKRIVRWQFIEDFSVFYKLIITTFVWTHSYCLTWSRLPLSACLSTGGVKESRQLNLACGTQNPFSAPSPFLAVLGCVCMSMLFLPKPYGEETSHTQKLRGFLDVSRRATAPPRSGNASPRHAAGAWASITPARTTKDPQGSTARREIWQIKQCYEPQLVTWPFILSYGKVLQAGFQKSKYFSRNHKKPWVWSQRQRGKWQIHNRAFLLLALAMTTRSMKS